MRINRLYVDLHLVSDTTLQLPPDQAHYLARVLRARPGQTIHVFNGSGGYFEAEVTDIRKRTVKVLLKAFKSGPPAGSLDLVLAQCISRGSHMDYTIQKATELGVAGIIPLFSEHGNVRLTGQALEKKLRHWRKIIISACEQCGRNVLPELAEPAGFDDWVSSGKNGQRLLLHPRDTTTLAKVTPGRDGLTIISGPEGGFSEHEVSHAIHHGCQPVNLGPRILRTETAAVAALSACQVLWGDMN